MRNKSEEWNKIYVDLATSLKDYQDATNFKYSILVYKPDTTITSKVLLDNIKIVL